jgi:TonB family protein
MRLCGSDYARLRLAARAGALAALALVLALLACSQAPPPPPQPVQPVPPVQPTQPVQPLPPIPREVQERERENTVRTVPGEKPIQQVMPFFSKPRPGQSRCNAWVIVAFTITPEGTVESPAVTQRCPERDKQMDSAALTAVRQWRYAPRSEPAPSRVSFDYQTEVPCDCPPPAP